MQPEKARKIRAYLIGCELKETSREDMKLLLQMRRKGRDGIGTERIHLEVELNEHFPIRIAEALRSGLLKIIAGKRHELEFSESNLRRLEAGAKGS